MSFSNKKANGHDHLQKSGDGISCQILVKIWTRIKFAANEHGEGAEGRVQGAKFVNSVIG